VQMTLDTMVMDNDEAEEREGCDPTYKKVKGFQPLQLIWEGKIIDAIFRRGKRHSNYGNDVEKMIRGIVKLIRTRYDASVLIVIRLDAGFFDEKIFRLCDELGVAFVATGKVYENIKKQVAAGCEGMEGIRQRAAELELCGVSVPVRELEKRLPRVVHAAAIRGPSAVAGVCASGQHHCDEPGGGSSVVRRAVGGHAGILAGGQNGDLPSPSARGR